MFNQSHGVHITPLVINTLGGGHTQMHTHTHIQTSAQNNFKKPGAPGLKTCNVIYSAVRVMFICFVLGSALSILMYIMLCQSKKSKIGI